MKKKEELQKILQEGRIYPVFQPIVSLRDGQLLGYEALSRIEGKTKIEGIEQIFELGVLHNKTWEIEKLCRKRILQTYSQFPDDIKKGKLFINVDPLVIRDDKFKQSYTRKQLEKRNINKNKIVIEITERNSIDDWKTFKKTVNHYKDEGYEIAIDDVGSCYSGLNAIAKLNPGYIKIDMELVRGIDKDTVKQALLKGLVETSKHTEFELIAEGIETEEELKVLIKLGVHYGQGFLLGTPNLLLLPIRQEIENLIKTCNIEDSKRGIWNANKFVLTKVAIGDYKAIDAYSQKYGEESLREAFNIMFEIVRKSISVFEAMYVVDENSCVVLIESERQKNVCQQIIKKFNEELSRLYSDNDLNKGYVEIETKKGNIKQRSLMNVEIELIG